MNIYSLSGVVAIIILYGNQMRVSLGTEVSSQSQHMVITVAQGFGNLKL